MSLLSKCYWNRGTVNAQHTQHRRFLEGGESWLSRQASVLNKPALWKKKSSKKNSFWSCHCSELASFDVTLTAMGLEIILAAICPVARKRKCIYPPCKKTTLTNGGLCYSLNRSNGRQAHQHVFIITLYVEDITAWLMSEHFSVSIFYECKRQTKQN